MEIQVFSYIPHPMSINVEKLLTMKEKEVMKVIWECKIVEGKMGLTEKQGMENRKFHTGEFHESIWTKDITMPQFPQLKGDIRTKVLIIGGGITGLLCAYFLKQAGVDYCLVEKNRICSGITRGTTAKITSQHGLIYHKLLKSMGQERAAMYLKAGEMAVSRYRTMGRQFDCDMEEKDSYIYMREKPYPLERELAALEKLGYPAELAEHLPLPFETAGAVRFPDQLQFHPLKFAAMIASGLNIYENSGVREMTEYLALTENGTIAAEKVIVATHFPFLNTRGSYFIKMYQQRAFVLALSAGPDVQGMYRDGKKDGLSFRNQKDVLLVGGGSRRTGHGLRDKRDFEALRATVSDILPQTRVIAEWAAQDCMSLDDMPYIGHYSKNTPDLFVATGYNKWGMTNSMVAAILLTDLVQEKENEYAPLFSSSRSMLRPQLAINAFEAAKGILHPTDRYRCSHMGCVLHWNREEKTWECPCHGSRFDEEGGLLDNPAMEGMNRKPENGK